MQDMQDKQDKQDMQDMQNTLHAQNMQIETKRLFFIDNLRSILIMMLIFLHTAMSFGPIEGWYYYEYHPYPIVSYLMYYIVAVNLAFMLALLFMVSAYFIPASCQKKGKVAFLKDRLIKLGIPIVIYILVISPLFTWLLETQYKGLEKTLPNYFLDIYAHLAFKGSGPMWFLFVLLVFTTGYVVISPKSQTITQPLPTRDFPGTFQILFVLLGVTLIHFLIRLVFPISNWLNLFGLTFVDLSHLMQYTLLFSVGIAAYRNRWFTRIPNGTGKTWMIIFILSVLLWPVLMIAGGIGEEGVYLFLGGFTWQSFLYGLWEMVVCISACIGFPWLFGKKMNHSHPVLQRVSAISFTVYLIHMPVIVGLGYALSGLAMHPLLKFFLLAFLGILSSFLGAFIVQSIGRIVGKIFAPLTRPAPFGT